MAYERLSDAKIKGDSLDAFIENTMKLYDRQVAARNSEEESRFTTLVLENDLSLEEQLDYRKSQLERVGDDPAERKRLRKEISTLKDLIQQEEFSDSYLQKLSDLSSGLSSIDSVINWLNDQKASATDSNILSKIETELVKKQGEKFNLTKQLLENQTDFALKDRTQAILDEQIGKVSAERNKAILAGNDEFASVLNLQLQSLTKAKNENSIEKDIKNFAVSTVTGYASATALLDAYNQKIAGASATGSIKIGDVTYNSAQEFWTFKRDSYLADNSSNGFFGRFNDEQNTTLKVKNSQNALTNSDILKSGSEYTNLLSRPELANYQFKVNSMRQDSVQSGVDLLAKKALTDYAVSLDLNKAVATLNALKAAGGNVDDAYASILQSAATTKSTQVSNILGKAQELLKADPNLTSEQAINQALSAGAGLVISPEQAASKTEAEIAKEAAKGAEAGAFAPDVRTTTAEPVSPTVPPVVPPQPKPTTPQAQPAQPTPTPPLQINKQLDFGVRDPQVKALQQFLNKQGFLVSQSGDGAPGSETDFFGPLTQAALKKFQAAQGIVSSGDPVTTGFGRLGPQTLSKIQELLK